MKISIMLIAVLAASVLAQIPTYEDYWYVYADGARIDLPIGHASPLVTDWDSDGDKDLILGRFQSGNLMMYENTNNNDSPILAYTGLMQANGSNIVLPSG